MMIKENYFKVINKPHISEKASSVMEVASTIVLKVAKDANKIKIKDAVEKIFKVKVKSVNTVLIKNKVKIRKEKFKKQCINRSKCYKKAYVILKKGQNLDLININK